MDKSGERQAATSTKRRQASGEWQSTMMDDRMSREAIVVVCPPTDEKVADLLTKPLEDWKFVKLRNKIIGKEIYTGKRNDCHIQSTWRVMYYHSRSTSDGEDPDVAPRVLITARGPVEVCPRLDC